MNRWAEYVHLLHSQIVVFGLIPNHFRLKRKLTITEVMHKDKSRTNETSIK